MSFEEWAPEELISCLSHRPRHIINGMISIPRPAKPSPIQRDFSSSLIGLLDTLPLELLHSILNMLDFQSLSRLSRVSLRGKATVESLPAYRDLIEHAPHALSALGLTRLISLYSAAKLRMTLLSEDCISCGQYGAFLFLPRCERCCYECLLSNQSLWVVSTALAGKCFDLTPRQLKRIPIMYSIPGIYFVGHKISRRRRLRLVSVKSAKQLGIMLHGSIEKIAETLATRRTPDATSKEFYTFKSLHSAPLDPLGRDPSTLPSQGNTPNDNFCGMASIPFPSLPSKNAPENGLWCRGCERTFELCRFKELPSKVLSESSPVGCDPFYVFLAKQNRARSRAEFLQHIRQCYGAREMVSRLGQRLKFNECLCVLHH